MMKKEYFKPEVLTVVADVAETILAGSPGLSETSADPSQPSLSREDDDLFANDNLY
jgi:hypothetical protein